MFETNAGGVWRFAGCADYRSKYEFGWHLSALLGDAAEQPDLQPLSQRR